MIVSPHFPPINAPDHQRVRTSLPYYEKYGWETYILAVDSKYVDGIIDEELEKSLPTQMNCCKVKAIPLSITRLLGIGSLPLRALPGLLINGTKIINKHNIDIIYFSTTMFLSMTLGVFWKILLGKPYVLDFQDPWVNDYYKKNKALPPGGRVKYGIGRIVAKLLEPLVVKNAAAIVSVSTSYIDTLSAKYDIKKGKMFLIPFGAPVIDFSYSESNLRSSIKFSKKYENWVYVGRGGKDMQTSVSALLEVVEHLNRQKATRKPIKLYFIGTSYAQGKRAEKTIEPLALKYNLQHVVVEIPHRVPYYDSIRILKKADRILIVGSNDKSYTASKLLMSLLADKPVLAIFHKDSLVSKLMIKYKLNTITTFGDNDSVSQIAKNILAELSKQAPPNDLTLLLKKYSADALTKRQTEVFAHAIEKN